MLTTRVSVVMAVPARNYHDTAWKTGRQLATVPVPLRQSYVYIA